MFNFDFGSLLSISQSFNFLDSWHILNFRWLIWISFISQLFRVFNLMLFSARIFRLWDLWPFQFLQFLSNGIGIFPVVRVEVSGGILFPREGNSGNVTCHLIVHCPDAVCNLSLLWNLLGVLDISRMFNFGSRHLVYSGHISLYRCLDWHGICSTSTGGRNLFRSATIASTLQGGRSSPSIF